MAGVLHVFSVAVVATSNGVLHLQIVEFGFVGGGSGVAYPSDLKLIAAVAQVASNCHHIFPLVGSNGTGGFGLSVGEKNILDTVKTEKGVSQSLASHHVAVFSVECRQHSGAAHQSVESILVERPAVDVRVYAVVACCTEEECFALLPLLTGSQEGLACLTHTGVGGILFEGGQLGGQLFSVCSQCAVSGCHCVVNKLCGNVLCLLIGQCHLFVEGQSAELVEAHA